MDKGQTDGAVRRQFRGTGLYWTLILALVLAVAIVIGIIQNSQGVRLKYLAWAGSLPLAVVLLATIVLTVALTSLVGVIWRRRRRHQLTDSVELRELRGQVQASRLAVHTGDLPVAGGETPARNPGASG
jgi:uncharacterized integral membrane protein